LGILQLYIFICWILCIRIQAQETVYITALEFYDEPGPIKYFDGRPSVQHDSYGVLYELGPSNPPSWLISQMTMIKLKEKKVVPMRDRIQIKKGMAFSLKVYIEVSWLLNHLLPRFFL